VTDLEQLWLRALQDVIGRAAHEVKNALNGVHLNLEAIRSRSQREGAKPRDLAAMAGAAADQLEALTDQTESILFLTRAPRSSSQGADVGETLRHLSRLMIPTFRDGSSLEVEGTATAAPTAASFTATRLALASGLLALARKDGAARCELQTGSETVVRFSHESGSSLDAAVASALAEHQIRTENAGSDLLIVFPET
jgi:signal transduction histidine kinase